MNVLRATFVLAAISQVISGLNYQIANGTLAKDGEFPYLVSLKINGLHACPATILNESYVLTAAECVANYKINQIKIQWGKLNLTDDNDKTIPAAAKCVPFNFESLVQNGQYNFAVVKLKYPLPSPSDEWQPVKLTNSDVTINETTYGYTGSWGAEVPYPTGRDPDTLKKLVLNIQPNNSCLNIPNRPWVYCVSSDDGSLCPGDSGAPLMDYDDVQIGMASYVGSLSCLYGKREQAFVRIGYYLKEIQDLLQKPWTIDNCW